MTNLITTETPLEVKVSSTNGENTTTTTTTTTTTDTDTNKPSLQSSPKKEQETDPIPLLSKDIIEEIFNSPVPYKDEEQKETCKRIVEELSVEEQEISARTSYAYWVAATTTTVTTDRISDEIRIRMAMRDARRFLVGENGNYQQALEALRFAIEKRKEYSVDIFRCCFPTIPTEWYKDHWLSPTNDVQEHEDLLRNKVPLYQSYILDDMNKQTAIVRGNDPMGRANVLRFPRSGPTSTERGEAFVATQMYTAQRSFAITEYLSRGREEKVILVFDYQNYCSSYAPSMSTLKEMAQIGQRMFPERLHILIVLDAPFWMRALYTVVRAFLSQDTLDKLELVYGEEKYDTVRKHINAENAMPHMLPDGKLTSEIDFHQYFHQVPFHCTYDHVLTTKTTTATTTTTTTMTS